MLYNVVTLDFSLNNRTAHHTTPEYLPLEIPVLYHDDYLVVLNKPSGLLSVKGIGPTKTDCLALRVASAIEGARIVHRLDMDTSGVIVMARDADTHRALSIQFQERIVHKEYVAIVGGVMECDQGQIEIPIRKDMKNPPKQCVDFTHGKPCFTKWEVNKRLVNSTRLRLKPTTGRSHQLRVHLNEIGHPILGDNLYASPEYLSMAKRLMLHAELLSFKHPATQSELTITAECPF